MTPFISEVVPKRLPSLPKQHALVFGTSVICPQHLVFTMPAICQEAMTQRFVIFGSLKRAVLRSLRLRNSCLQ